MNSNLFTARFAILTARNSSTNQEKVLAEIIRMSKIKRGLIVKELVSEIPDRLTMTESLFRKTLSELFKENLLIKIGVTIYVNPAFINLLNNIEHGK